MLKNLLHKMNLYEKYNKLITDEGKKIFIRTVYTLSICTAAIIFIWYCGIVSLSSNGHVFWPEQLQNGKLFKGSNETIALAPKSIENITASTSTTQASVVTGPAVVSEPKPDNLDKPGSNENKNIQNTNNNEKIKEGIKEPEAKKDVKSQKSDKKKTSVQKPIYAGANRTNVALTFDDGYNKKTVIKVLDVLKENNIKATFFIIGRVLDDYPDVWKRAVNEGHQICNHTTYHEILTKLSDEKVKNEIMGWETCVKRVLGEDYLKRMKQEFPYLRLPGGGGSKSDRILYIAQSCGYKVIGWNLETNSSVINPMKKKNHTTAEIAAKIQQHVVNGCSNGSIILLHFNDYDITNIEGIITGIKKRGYGMQTVTQVISEE